MSDSPFLRELVENIRRSTPEKTSEQRPALTGYRGLLASCLDQALDMIGRGGKDVLYGLLEVRYNLRSADIASNPGVYMSALRDVLGSSCQVIEKYMLSRIQDETGIQANSLEEA